MMILPSFESLPAGLGRSVAVDSGADFAFFMVEDDVALPTSDLLLSRIPDPSPPATGESKGALLAELADLGIVLSAPSVAVFEAVETMVIEGAATPLPEMGEMDVPPDARVQLAAQPPAPLAGEVSSVFPRHGFSGPALDVVNDLKPDRAPDLASDLVSSLEPDMAPDLVHDLPADVRRDLLVSRGQTAVAEHLPVKPMGQDQVSAPRAVRSGGDAEDGAGIMIHTAALAAGARDVPLIKPPEGAAVRGTEGDHAPQTPVLQASSRYLSEPHKDVAPARPVAAQASERGAGPSLQVSVYDRPERGAALLAPQTSVDPERAIGPERQGMTVLSATPPPPKKPLLDAWQPPPALHVLTDTAVMSAGDMPLDAVPVEALTRDVGRTDPVTQGRAAVLPHGPDRVLSVARQIREAPEGTTEIRLDPPELGRLRFVVAAHDGGVQLVIHAAQADTADLLRRHLDVLSAELRQAGYASVDVSVGDDGRQQHPRHMPTAVTILTDADSPSIPRNAAQSGLDLRL